MDRFYQRCLDILPGLHPIMFIMAVRKFSSGSKLPSLNVPGALRHSHLSKGYDCKAYWPLYRPLYRLSMKKSLAVVHYLSMPEGHAALSSAQTELAYVEGSTLETSSSCCPTSACPP